MGRVPALSKYMRCSETARCFPLADARGEIAPGVRETWVNRLIEDKQSSERNPASQEAGFFWCEIRRLKGALQTSLAPARSLATTVLHRRSGAPAALNHINW